MLNNITLIAQSALRIVNSLGEVIYFDPFQLDDRYYNDADYIFITHSHYDHLSIEDILKIKKDNTVIIGPSDIEEIVKDIGFNNILLVEPNNKYKINNISFETVYAYNINKSFHKKEYNWVGYIVVVDNNRVYVAGDTDHVEELDNIKCDIACVPVGGTYTMTSREASELIKIIKPKLAIPIHYKTVVGSVEDAYSFKKDLDEIIDVKILMN